jgi:hypothetical protein
LQDVLLDAALSQQPHHQHLLLLADAVRTRLRLQVNLGIPVTAITPEAAQSKEFSSRTTSTFCFWPMLCARAGACRSICGFQSLQDEHQKQQEGFRWLVLMAGQVLGRGVFVCACRSIWGFQSLQHEDQKQEADVGRRASVHDVGGRAGVGEVCARACACRSIWGFQSLQHEDQKQQGAFTWLVLMAGQMLARGVFVCACRSICGFQLLQHEWDKQQADVDTKYEGYMCVRLQVDLGVPVTAR